MNPGNRARTGALGAFLRGPGIVVLAGILLGAGPVSGADVAGEAVCEKVRRIWNEAPHNAFTDLTRFRGRWICVFREGRAHVSPDGAVRVLESRDGESWTSVARLTSPRGDLRDPKIVPAPGRRLMLTAAVALPQPSAVKHQTLAWFSRDGREWGEPVDIGDPNLWLWRVTWDRGVAYGVGYDTTAESFIRLYRSEDGRRFEALVPRLWEEGHPNETSIVFEPGRERRAVCLLRFDGQPGTGKIGTALPPYRDWTWKDLGQRIGGPHLLRLSDGRWVAAVRLHQGKVRTGLAWVDPDAGTLTPFLDLPSSGDSSYPGLVWHRDRLWVSYYSSHEGRTSIYLATVRLGRKD